jgi:hypothetical protein
VTSPLLELWYANQDGLVDVLGIPSSDQARYLAAKGDAQSDTARKQHLLSALLEERLLTDPPPELQRILLHGTPLRGQVVAIDQAFYFRRERLQRRIIMHAELNTESSWRMQAKLDPGRFPFSSTHDHLSRRKSVFTIATVIDTDKNVIALRPLFIGQRSWGVRKQASGSSENRRIYPQQIDQFRDVDWSTAPGAADIAKMKAMAEADVKDSLAKILGLPFIAKDWGGERSDMVTNNLMVEGVQTSSAWLLKGKSVQRAMRVPDLGKNGDQIERLATDSAEVLVVQHNQEITAAVINLAAAFANDMRNPRRFMIMDGLSTAQVLKHHGLLA